MRVTEKLIQDMNRKRRQGASRLADEEEETMTYASWKQQKPLNQQEGAFNQQKMAGINTQENVFDRQAIFRTDLDKSARLPH